MTNSFARSSSAMTLFIASVLDVTSNREREKKKAKGIVDDDEQRRERKKR